MVKKGDTASRATWAVYEEFDLLQAYEEARKDPKAATDKGINKSAWNQLTANLNAKHKRTFDKGQYKSKVSRLLQDYDIYMEMKGKSGV
ncbi:hypothetical protein PHYBOEH_002808 [Phytophthora boehmeriae]|uniref:Myb/SANT-like domain-containing protein n=1 Tax=Phytophthora boehmeriae TaxID=109152 RepID=A0A8T1V218_9STRA|nr:hypothetical protein PHYBOEH_002808 [Phytophthora boehmeriae]